MPYSIVSPSGTSEIIIPAGSSASLFTQGSAQVYQILKPANFPQSSRFLMNVVASSAVFGPYPLGATLVIENGPLPTFFEIGLAPFVNSLSLQQTEGSRSLSTLNLGVWAFVGDSFIAQSVNSYSSTVRNYELLGLVTALRQASRQRVRVPSFVLVDDGASGMDPTSGYIWAKSGKASDWFVAQNYHMSAAATDAGVVFSPLSTNDTSQSVPFATSVANYTLIWQTLLAAGKTVVTMPILPRFISGSSTAVRNASHRLNAWGRKYASENGIIWADPTPKWIDPTNADGDPIAGVIRDAILHPSGEGNFVIADAILSAVDKLLPAFDNRFMNITDVYDATLNPSGNLITNGLMAGTAGTITAGTGGTPMSGSLADSWTAARDSDTSIGTLTCVWSKVARSDGEVGTWQQGVVSGTPAAVRELRMTQSITIGNIAAGDKIALTAEVEIDAGAANVFSLTVGFLDDNVDNVEVRDGDRGNTAVGNSSTIYLPTSARKLVYETPVHTIGTTPTAMTVTIRIPCQESVAASLTFRIGRVKLYKL